MIGMLALPAQGDELLTPCVESVTPAGLPKFGTVYTKDGSIASQQRLLEVIDDHAVSSISIGRIPGFVGTEGGECAHVGGCLDRDEIARDR